MDLTADLADLPAFLALDAWTVLDGPRRGASVQVDASYFAGRERGLALVDGETDDRLAAVRSAREAFADVSVDVDAVTADALRAASERLGEQLRSIPEVEFLVSAYPGTAFVVPEWLRAGDEVSYGVRAYFLEADAATGPRDVVDRNVRAVVDDEFGRFEAYQGRLHGYPDCCVAFYRDRTPAEPPPEWQSVEPFADEVRNEAVAGGSPDSIADVLPTFPDRAGGEAFFAREFFPEPGCEVARERGRAVVACLASAVPGRLLADYRRLVYGFDYLVARAVCAGARRRPPPGALGREHRLFYAPLRAVLADDRYAPSE